MVGEKRRRSETPRPAYQSSGNRLFRRCNRESLSSWDIAPEQRPFDLLPQFEIRQFMARVVGPMAGNVLLRREQYRISDDKARAGVIASYLVAAKFANCKSVILRALRYHGDIIKAEQVTCAEDARRCSIEAGLCERDLERLRGIEGDAGRIYFDVFNELIFAGKADFVFAERNRRPPLDRVNALLSFAYTMLYHDMSSAVETSGLDPAVGFLHRDRPGRSLWRST